MFCRYAYYAGLLLDASLAAAASDGAIIDTLPPLPPLTPRYYIAAAHYALWLPLPRLPA